MGWHQGASVPFDLPAFGPTSCSRRRKRRAALVFEIVASITRGFDHVLAAALGECHHVETSPLIDAEISQSLERIHGWLLESSSTAQRLRALLDTPAVCHAPPEEAADLDRTLREFVTVVRPLCRADGRRRGVRVRVRAHFSSGALVSSSGERLRELATGLLSQAIDALPEGGVVDLETGDAENGPWLEVRYADDHALAIPIARQLATDEIETESETHASTTLRVRFHRLVPGAPYSDPAPRALSLRATSVSKPM
jgi:signal transduction histidine kinase